MSALDVCGLPRVTRQAFLSGTGAAYQSMPQEICSILLEAIANSFHIIRPPIYAILCGRLQTRQKHKSKLVGREHLNIGPDR